MSPSESRETQRNPRESHAATHPFLVIYKALSNAKLLAHLGDTAIARRDKVLQLLPPLDTILLRNGDAPGPVDAPPKYLLPFLRQYIKLGAQQIDDARLLRHVDQFRPALRPHLLRHM